jgi:hypothetical protein
MPAAVEICTWCERKYEVHQRKRTNARGSFCSEKCRTQYHYDYERQTGWYCMEMIRHLLKGKALPKFKAREYPGIEGYRAEWNSAATMLRNLAH